MFLNGVLGALDNLFHIKKLLFFLERAQPAILTKYLVVLAFYDVINYYVYCNAWYLVWCRNQDLWSIDWISAQPVHCMLHNHGHRQGWECCICWACQCVFLRLSSPIGDNGMTLIPPCTFYIFCTPGKKWIYITILQMARPFSSQFRKKDKLMIGLSFF